MTAETRDPLDLLTAARPTDDGLARSWTPDRAERTLDRLLADAPSLARTSSVVTRPPRRRTARPRRWVVLAGVACLLALVAAGATVVARPEALSPAQAVDHAVASARGSSQATVRRGTWWHVRMVTTSAVEGRQTASVWERWTGPEGTEVGTSREGDGRPVPYRAPDGVPGSLGSIDFVRSLPTDPTALVRTLDRAVGQDRHSDEAAFDSLVTLLYQGTPSPAVRAAAIRALADLPGVVVRTERLEGRQVLRVDHTGVVHLGGEGSTAPDDGKPFLQATWIDPETSLVLQSRTWTAGAPTSWVRITEQGLQPAPPAGLLDPAPGPG